MDAALHVLQRLRDEALPLPRIVELNRDALLLVWPDERTAAIVRADRIVVTTHDGVSSAFACKRHAFPVIANSLRGILYSVT